MARKKDWLYASPTFAPLPDRQAALSALPYDCGASLPIVQRYTDQRYRAVVRSRLPEARLEFQLQVACVLRLIPVEIAAAIFQWKPRSTKYAREMEARFSTSETVARYERACWDVLQPDHVLALYQSAAEGGWVQKGKKMAPILRLMLRAYRDEGLTLAQIADKTGLPFHSVAYGVRVPHGQRLATRRLGLVI